MKNKKKDKDEIRTFIAIDISRDVRNAISGLISELKLVPADVRWVRVEGIHLTLKFLGNIQSHMVNDILMAMERSADGIGAFKVEVKGTGAFPNFKRPRVFWVGVKEETGKLARLASAIEKELKVLGFKEEGRHFTPHLTLGRVNQGGRVEKLCDIIRRRENELFGEFDAGEVVLFRSELKPTGAEYTKLGAVPLK